MVNKGDGKTTHI